MEGVGKEAGDAPVVIDDTTADRSFASTPVWSAPGVTVVAEDVGIGTSSSLTWATIRFHGFPLTVTTIPLDNSSLKDGVEEGSVCVDDSGRRRGYEPGREEDVYGEAEWDV